MGLTKANYYVAKSTTIKSSYRILFGGQAYLASMEPKITRVSQMLEDAGRADEVHIEVDGGIGPTTIAGAASAGANVLIAGSALYRDPEGLSHAVADLRARADAARIA
ncbi:MAG: hypothetical protein AAGG08_13560 [Actinomycetota bacterium]